MCRGQVYCKKKRDEQGYLVCRCNDFVELNKPNRPDDRLEISCLDHILNAVDVEPMPDCIEHADGILPFQQFLEQLGDAGFAVGRLGQDFRDDVGDECRLRWARL